MECYRPTSIRRDRRKALHLESEDHLVRRESNRLRDAEALHVMGRHHVDFIVGPIGQDRKTWQGARIFRHHRDDWRMKRAAEWSYSEGVLRRDDIEILDRGIEGIIAIVILPRRQGCEKRKGACG